METRLVCWGGGKETTLAEKSTGDGGQPRSHALPSTRPPGRGRARSRCGGSGQQDAPGREEGGGGWAGGEGGRPDLGGQHCGVGVQAGDELRDGHPRHIPRGGPLQPAGKHPGRQRNC